MQKTKSDAAPALHASWFYALALMWLQGGLASAWPSGYQQGVTLLAQAGLPSGLIAACIWGGVAADLAMAGGALWVAIQPAHRRSYCAACLVLIGVYTVLASVLAPALWLDPFGALAKNIPIWVLCCTAYVQKVEV